MSATSPAPSPTAPRPSASTPVARPSAAPSAARNAHALAVPMLLEHTPGGQGRPSYRETASISLASYPRESFPWPGRSLRKTLASPRIAIRGRRSVARTVNNGYQSASSARTYGCGMGCIRGVGSVVRRRIGSGALVSERRRRQPRRARWSPDRRCVRLAVQPRMPPRVGCISVHCSRARNRVDSMRFRSRSCRSGTRGRRHLALPGTSCIVGSTSTGRSRERVGTASLQRVCLVRPAGAMAVAPARCRVCPCRRPSATWWVR